MPVYKSLKKIAQRMDWKSPSTVLRRHKLDQFPLYEGWSKRGSIWVTSDALIENWERKKVEMCRGARLKTPWKVRHKPTYRRYTWRMRSENQTDNGTVGPAFRGKKKGSLREELGWDQLGPTSKAYVKANELTPEEREEIERYEAKSRSKEPVDIECNTSPAQPHGQRLDPHQGAD